MSVGAARVPVRARAARWELLATALLAFVNAAPERPALAATLPSAEARTEARAMHLADTAAWHRLLHVHPTSAHGWEAEPDGPTFYLSSRGAFDPEAEMMATIEGLYAPASLADKHASCIFPARARFLTESLSLEGLPRPSCLARDAFYGRLRPKKIHFVFSAYHVESPASAFGHVLLRIERDDSTVLRRDAAPHALADLGIDYSADVGPENAITYALKGLVGQFRGTFKAMPFAAKVREYQDFETRDLWEYELALSDLEKATFIEHLWELGSTSFDYFYLSENCAYHVLALLDVVRPEAHLLEGLSLPVLPAAALSAVWRAPGLVANVHYRPSLRKVADTRLRALRDDERALAHALADGSRGAEGALVTLPKEAQARVLDAALDLVDLAHPELLVDDSESVARTRKYDLSVRRAAIDVTSPELPVAPPENGAPHLAHGTRRVAVGSGYASLGGAFVEGRARLTLHDTLDPSAGLPALASLEAFEATLRAYPGSGATSGAIEMERLTVVRVEKLAPLRTLDGGVSYRFFMGGDRVRDRGCAGCFVAKLDAGGGVAWTLSHGAIVFARANLTFEAAEGLSGIDGRGARLGAGPSGGVRLDLGESLRAQGEARLAWLPFAPATWTAEASFETRLVLGRASALGFFLRRTWSSADVGLSTFVYF